MLTACSIPIWFLFYGSTIPIKRALWCQSKGLDRPLSQIFSWDIPPCIFPVRPFHLEYFIGRIREGRRGGGGTNNTTGTTHLIKVEVNILLLLAAPHGHHNVYLYYALDI